MGDYTSVPDQSADLPDIASASAGQTATVSSSADPVIPADSASQPVQANSPSVEVPTQTDSSIPADSKTEATVSATSIDQLPASDVPPAEVPVSDIPPVSPPVSEQPEVAPEQVFEASASATVSTQENPSVASVSFGDITSQNPSQNSSVQLTQNPPESPVVSAEQTQQNTISPPSQEPLVQPVEATEQPSILDSSHINPPIQVQPDVPVNTPSVSTSPSGQTQHESAEIKSEPLQPIQNTQIDSTNAHKSSFGDLLDNKTDEVVQPTINIEPIESPVSKPPIQTSPPVVNPPTVQPAPDTGSAAIRRQHAIEARKQRHDDNLNKIIELIQKKGNVDNLDVRDFLHVSQTTATDYLHTLVNSGKLKRDGKAKATTYSLT